MKIKKTDSFIAIAIIGLALLFSNYFYTFSGFVAYTSEERRASQIISSIYKTQTNSDERATAIELLTEEDKKLVAKYITQYKGQHKRHKTIQQFYIEEIFIILLLGLVVIYINKEN